jgi:hypothetical protein
MEWVIAFIAVAIFLALIFIRSLYSIHIPSSPSLTPYGTDSLNYAEEVVHSHNCSLEGPQDSHHHNQEICITTQHDMHTDNHLLEISFCPVNHSTQQSIRTRYSRFLLFHLKRIMEVGEEEEV